jgi:hypothetical protein
MKHPSDDPIQILRDANPHPTQPVPSQVSERLWARIDGEIDARPTPSRRWGLALGGITTVAAAVALVLVIGRPAADAGGPSVALGDSSAMCMEVYSPETLPNRQLAFDGTVTEIADDPGLDFGVLVTFDVNQVYIGDLGDTVTLQASGLGGVGGDTVDSEGGPGMSVGDRLLISGDEGFAWTCGFSRTWSQEMADEWEAATAASR